ncbi:MAG TPA: FtsW/RodA/SpoVE family cell cycle protein [Cyclobacteriaceae bacterium]|nr:FtsW/RodA/SpoVE family cell cycle protein [Cyclobacteriaceae bacterium]
MIVRWLQNNLKGDPIIWSIVILLSLISVFVVYSATGSLAFRLMDGNTEYYLFRHSMMILLSLFAMWVAHRIDYRYYSKISRFFLWISVPLLIFTWKFGVTLNEASRWISIPFINQIFQPSDLAKLALITNLAAMLSKRQQNIDDLSNTLVPMLLWCGLISGLIAMTNFSTAILLLLTCMLVLFLGRVPMKYLLMLLFIGILAGAVAFSFGQRGQTVVSRVKEFLNPTEVPYQAQQSYIAIATGGIAGKGPGNSDQKNFLPYPYSDFIYAIIIEEYGMIGGITVVLLYLALLYRGIMTAAKSDRAFGGLLSAGLSFALVMQSMVNMGVAVGLGPITGLPLPLVSMGGTSLLFTGITLGIILSVSRGEIEDADSQVNEIRNVSKAA